MEIHIFFIVHHWLNTVYVDSLKHNNDTALEKLHWEHRRSEGS